MKAEIIRLLKSCDGYLSGQELCEKLNVSRTAVWKVINQLREEGYEIEAVRNKGYRLVERADVMTAAELESCMGDQQLGLPVKYYDKIDSTNNQVRRLAEEGAEEGLLVVAECQEAGKGRRGRVWKSPAGSGIWMSFLLKPQVGPEHASMLTLVAAMAVASGIQDITGMETKIKWPNDLVLSGKKICGILTEMSTDLDSIRYIIVGIGINVNTSDFPEDIAATATSLYLESGKSWKRSELIAAIMKRMEQYYEIFLKTADLSGLKEEYESKLANLGRQVKVLAPKQEYCGICRGITDGGELLVEREDGSISQVMSGEVSVRGIYGYV